jgi:hypothetical protein
LPFVIRTTEEATEMKRGKPRPARGADRRRPRPKRPAPRRRSDGIARPDGALPALGDWWKLSALALRVHVHPRTLRRWIEGEPFFRKVRGTFFAELGEFRAWWERQGFDLPKDAP